MNEFLSFIKDNILGGLSVNIEYTRNERTKIDSLDFTETADGGVFIGARDDYERFLIEAKTEGDCALFSIDALSKKTSFPKFRGENSINLSIGGKVKPDGIRGFYHLYTCCLQPAFFPDLESLGNRTHTALIKFGDVHYCILGICGTDYRCDFDGAGVHISFSETGRHSVSGPIFAVSRSKDPFDAMKSCFRFARKMGAITVPLKEEREIPEMVGKLGYCTFNTYELDITSELIYKKLDEYKELGIPLRWVLIDDGWQSYEGKFMYDLKVDRNKFPEGLKATISRIKNDYGVEKVGVWHAMDSYWCGIEEGSAAHLEQAENLMKTKGGLIIPSLDEERGFAFWDHWYAYLSDCGVDFVKIDSQSSFPKEIEGDMPTPIACRRAHAAIEKAAQKYFGGIIFNCMGMDCENVYARPYSVIARNSRDFGIYEESNFYTDVHDFAMVNAYGSVWHDMMCCCDFDMWWPSHKPSAIYSATLHAIHDGPCYISDPEICNPEIVYRTVGHDGVHYRFDHGAYPSLDCLYEGGNVFRVWNEKDDAFAAVLYNITDEDFSDSFRLSDIPCVGGDKEYLAYEFFTNTYRRVRKSDVIEEVIEANGIRAYSCFPIVCDEGGEYVMLGDTYRYISAADPNKKKVYIKDIL